MFTRKLLLILVIFCVGLNAFSEDVPNNTQSGKLPKSDKSKYKKSLKDCKNTYSVTCLKVDIVNWVEKLSEEDEYNIIPGVSLVRENGSARSNTADVVADVARSFPDDPSARLDAYLVKKVMSYLNSHSVRLNPFSKQALGETARGGGGGGGGGKGGGGGGMMEGGGTMLLGAGMLKATLGALALGTIAAIAGKALMAGLMSLVLSTIIGLKSLHHKEEKSTYEIISKPIYTHSSSHSEIHDGHGYGHSSYGRSYDIALPIGLQPGYKPK